MQTSDGTALRVLTNRSLLSSIAAFSPGISYSIYQVKQKLVCASDAYNEDAKAPQDMQLWQNAIMFGDMQTLEALRVLSQTSKLGRRLEELMRGYLGFALMHTRDLTLLDWLHASFWKTFYSDPCSRKEYKHLGEQGDVEVIKWLVRHKYRITMEILSGAARKGHLEVLQFVYPMHSGIFRCGIGYTIAAAAFGHLDVVRFFHETRQPCHHRAGFHNAASALNAAATNGHLHVVQYLHEQAPSSGSATTEAMDGAAANGHLEVVQFLHFNRSEGCTAKAMADAVENGHDEVVSFLRDIRRLEEPSCTTLSPREPSTLDSAMSIQATEDTPLRRLSRSRSE